MIDFDQSEDEGPPGAPAWMATFADLMSLLLAFFVLLLSFSEMDLQRYESIAGSMEEAFGVQRKIEAKAIPMGTSIIAQEFSPGRTEPTVLNRIEQVASESADSSLEIGTPTDSVGESTEELSEELSEEQAEALLEEAREALERETAADAERLRDKLAEEIENEIIDIESEGRFITIRIRENGSFPSGSATLTEGFGPIMQKLRAALAETPGLVAIEGHTDNVPIKSGPFRSNWQLSTERALSVTHELLASSDLQNRRMMVVGLADTQPIDDNSTWEGRARNRRVEIVIRQSIADADQEDES